MGLLTRPTVLVEIQLAKYPATEGTLMIRLTNQKRPIGLEGAFYEPRIQGISESRRRATDRDGNLSVGKTTLTIDDKDGSLGRLLRAGLSTEYWFQREVGIWVISGEGLDSGLNPTTVPPMHRGWISKVTRNSHRQVIVEVTDAVGSQMTGFNLGKQVLQIKVSDLTSSPPKDTANRRLPIYAGIFSDRGLTDVNGDPADVGIIPLFEVCDVDSSDVTATPAPTFADPPVITTFDAQGVRGELDKFYGVTLITPYGETPLSNIVAISGAISRDPTNYNWIYGTYDNSNGNKVRVWVSDSPDPSSFHQWLDEADYFGTPGTFGYGDGAKLVDVTAGVPTVTNFELDPPKELAVPAQNTAQTNMNLWTIMAACLGNGYHFDDIYGSDLVDGSEPKRMRLTPGHRGVDILTPEDPDWPFPNRWIELNGIRFSGILVRGPILEHHRNGSVTMAANMCGPMVEPGGGSVSDADLDELVINQAFYGMQHILNEFCVKNKGRGYRNDDYFTLETYANGDSILKTSEFTKCQNKTISWIGGLGYKCSIIIDDENTTWRSVLQEWCQNYGCHYAVNRYGQVFPFLISTVPDDEEVVSRYFRERIEIKRTEEPEMSYDEIVNQYNLSYYYNPDQRKYIANPSPIYNAQSIAAHVPGGVIDIFDLRGLKQEDRKFKHVSDRVTALDVINRELVRRQRRGFYPSITVGMMGMDREIGDIVAIVDSHGLGATGDINKAIILEHATRLDEREVSFVLQDLTSIQTDPGELGDETDGSAHEVGDETGATLPPSIPIG